MVTGSTTLSKERDFTSILPMEVNTMENSKIINFMVMENKHGKMEAVIKVNIIWVLYKVKEHTVGPTARNTLEAG